MQIESEPNVLSSAKRKSSELHVEEEALKMEITPANEKRLKEITKELADVEEEVRDLETKFASEKEVFERISSIKLDIEAKKREAQAAQNSGDYAMAAKLQNGMKTGQNFKRLELCLKILLMKKLLLVSSQDGQIFL